MDRLKLWIGFLLLSACHSKDMAPCHNLAKLEAQSPQAIALDLNEINTNVMKKSNDLTKIQEPIVNSSILSSEFEAQNEPHLQLALRKNKFKWSWPVKGKIIKAFLEHDHAKGIDIAGKLGTPIKAALDGTIVYQGNALKGYGNLIIIKHDDSFLSAYAHNDINKVKEGQKVKQGQVIATMGRTDADKTQLHFEIRYQGKPINPLALLK